MIKKIIIKLITLFTAFFILSGNIYEYSSGYYIVISAYDDKSDFIRDYKLLKKNKIKTFGEQHFNFSNEIYYLYYSDYYTGRESAEVSLPQIEEKIGRIISPPGQAFINPEPVTTFSITELIEEEKTDFGSEFIFRKPQPGYPYTIIAEKKGAKLKKQKALKTENQSMAIVDSVPQNGIIHPGAPALIFFNDHILIPSIVNRVHLKKGKTSVPGIIRIFEYSPGKSALSITPKEINKPGKITLAISSKITNPYSESLKKPFSMSYTYSKRSTAYKNRITFEGRESFSSSGDVSIIDSITSVINADEGNKFLGISNSDYILSDKQSINNKTGYYSISTNALKKIDFSYNFISCEFNEYISNLYGDISILVAATRNYQKSWIISSVYSVGYNNTGIKYRAFYNLPDKGDSFTGMTGWKKFTAPRGQLKGPVTLTFITTDIGDPEISSILLLDNINLR
jgi:hypothetical protein